MNAKLTKYTWTVILVGIWLIADAQVSRVEFGKNRIQYHDDFDQWLLYESQNFITYWYGKARNHGISAVKLAEQDHDEILDLIEHRINEKIEILVYSDVSDQKQSNIGADETFVSSSGRTKLEGTKLFVYFNGDHEDLRIQIRKGIAEVFLNSMFYGSNLQELVQSRRSNNIPVWFTEGLIEYIGRSWDSESDDDLRNIFTTFKRKKTFKRLSGTNPVRVGQSVWQYIATTYGRSEISNLLYLTRINRNVEDAFLYVFGIPFESLTDQWLDANTQRYEAEKEQLNAIADNTLAYKKRKKVPISELRYSPDGKYLAIVDNQISKTRVVLKNLETGEQQKVFKHGFRNNIQETDYDYPSIAWHPNSQGLYILYEARNDIWLEFHNLATGEVLEQLIPERYDRVYSMDILNDVDLVFSALSNGKVDLFLYKTNTRQSTPLTNDIYDDLEVRSIEYAPDKQGLVFASNRPDAFQLTNSLDTVLPFKNFNLFLLGLDNQSAPTIHQLSRRDQINLRTPVPTGIGQISFLSDANGVTNRETATISPTIIADRIEIVINRADTIIRPRTLVNETDTSIQILRTLEESGYEFTDQKTAYQLRNIMVYDVSTARGRSAEVYKVGEDFKIVEKELSYTNAEPTVRPPTSESETTPLPSTQQKEVSSKEPKEGEVIRSSENQSGQVFLFQSEYEDMDRKKTDRILDNEIADGKAVNTNRFLDRQARFDDDTKINRLRIIPYRLKFQLHGLTTNVDNSLLFGGLDSYAGFKQEFDPVPPGILLKATFKDLFEDYSFEGGVRFPTTFNGTEYFLVFDDNKKRIDKQYAFYRKTTNDNTVVTSGADAQRTRNTILLGHYRLKYPLDIYNSVRATATLRQDKFTFLATDITTLDQSDETAQRIGIKLEYVFDNSIDIDLNIRSGTRFKFSIEAIKRFKIDTDPLDVSFSQGFMTVLGLDARQYFNFAKHSVFAVRGAAGTSFGSEKVLYYLGGTDNWLIPRTNQDIPQPEGNFAYQTISPNLRGFDYNIRNGSTFAILNAELRIPFVKYLSRRPIRMSLLRHLQLVGFADVGAAWEGLSPFDEDNPINILNLQNPPTVFVRVNYFRDPLVAGYGVGLRTQLFGYFLRVDYAWGLETRRVQEPKLHFSLGVDF